MKRATFFAIALLGLVACKAQKEQAPQATPPPPPPQRVREPAVAGLFYPRDTAELTQILNAQLSSAPPQSIDGELRAVIVPHAGYVYSGQTAAFAYRAVLGRDYSNVVILAASHYAMFPGAAVANTDAYRTPLGLVPVAPRAKELALQSPFISERPCIMQRPQWAPQSSKPLPAPGQDTPDTWEHSGEVQVPFLQRVLKDFAIIPVVTGDVDPAQMAAVLDKFLNDKTLLVVSTDLSHYHPYDEARGLDTNTVSAMVNLDIDRMAAAGDACAKAPIMTVLHLAKQRGWKTKLLDYRNSGDTSGNKAGVVGYAAIAFYEPHPQTYNTSERKQMLELARRTLRTVVTGATVDDPKLTGKLAETKGCFVTLTIGGQLRGCIGHIIAQEPLYKAIIDNATSAALRDTRFTPVRPDEVDKIEVEVSVLTAPEPLAFTTPEDLLAKLRPHRDGVVLQVNGRGSTYLPQVWEQIPDKVVFLDSLSQKAGCAPGAWRQPGTQVHIYHVEAFKESDY